MRALRLLVLVVLLAGAPALAGCFGATTSPVRVVPYYTLNDAEAGRGTEFAFFLESTSPFRQTLPVSVQGLPGNWTFEPETQNVTIRGEATSSLIVRITPGRDAAHGPQSVRVMLGDTPAEVTVNVGRLGDEPLRAGIGTKLYYVLWYENGTLASTNDPAIMARDGLGRPVLHDANDTLDGEPLKVYVGGRRGQDPPEPYNGTGYRPVIPGFDARLQESGDGTGMVAGETLAVRIPKERAYTVRGNEDHVLYGEDLNFLIRIVSVDILNARQCDLPVCPPH